MSFKTVRKDITTIKADAIVNNLGVNSINYGRVCRSIVKKANSTEYEDILKSKYKNISIGDIFCTPGYDLPCNQIIHIVTPHYKDDPNLYGIEGIIRDLLLYCYKNKIYKLAIPLIGTGEDKYPKHEVAYMISSMFASFSEFYPKMQLIFVAAPKGIEDKYDSNTSIEGNIYNDRFREAWEEEVFTQQTNKYLSNLELDEVDYDDRFRYSKDFFQQKVLKEEIAIKGMPLLEPSAPTLSSSVGRINDTFLASEYLFDRYRGSNNEDYGLVEYIETFITNVYGNKKYPQILNRVKRYLGNNIPGPKGQKAYSEYKRKRSTPSRTSLYKIVLALQTNEDEAQDLFEFCGLKFCPKRLKGYEGDYFIRNCLRLQIYSFTKVNDGLTQFDPQGLYRK